jgi:hypothetical protein
VKPKDTLEKITTQMQTKMICKNCPQLVGNLARLGLCLVCVAAHHAARCRERLRLRHRNEMLRKHGTPKAPPRVSKLMFVKPPARTKSAIVQPSAPAVPDNASCVILNPGVQVRYLPSRLRTTLRDPQSGTFWDDI